MLASMFSYMNAAVCSYISRVVEHHKQQSGEVGRSAHVKWVILSLSPRELTLFSVVGSCPRGTTGHTYASDFTPIVSSI